MSSLILLGFLRLNHVAVGACMSAIRLEPFETRHSATVTARLLPRLMRLDALDDFRVVDDGFQEVVPHLW